MQIDQAVLESNVREYLDSPEGKEALDELENSVLFNVIASVIMLPVSLLLICTIFLAKEGFLMFWGLLQSFFTGEVFRNQQKKLLSDPDKTHPLILGTIIIGPAGHGLVLGTFSRETQQNTDLIGRKSVEFGHLYSDGSSNRDDREMVKLLKDDTYVPNRRRKVPRSHSEGHELILFDMELNLDEARLSEDDFGWVAGVATIDSEQDPKAQKGSIVQIPWSVVSAAVTSDELI